MQRIHVRVIKDKSIHLKINSTILDEVKKMAILNGHFVGDYINQILLEHLKNVGTTVEMHINDSSLTNTQKTGE